MGTEEETESKPNPLKRSFEDLCSSNHETEAMDVDPTFIPTDFQLKVYEAAMKRNTIVAMETEVGKTRIALMMIKEIGKSLVDGNSDKKLIIFLAPTVHLVHQQYKEIKLYTGLQVEEYFGAKGIDQWNAETWEKELSDHDVLVMTPQIFLNALRKAYICFDLFCFIILDECHHAIGNHPYVKIMQEFYRKSSKRPKIFGMTALPMVRKDQSKSPSISSIKDSEEKIRALESLLDSQICMAEDNIHLEKSVPTAKSVCRFYDAPQVLNSELKMKLESAWSKVDATLLSCQNSLPSQSEETIKTYKSLQDKLVGDHEKIMFCLENLGIMCAHEAVKICIESTPKVEECEVFKDCFVHYGNFLEETLSVIEESHDHNEPLDVANGGTAAVATGRISSKLYQLMQIFQSFGKDMEVLCIIFVEQIITAKVIARVMNKTTDFSHFSTSYLDRSNLADGGISPGAETGVSESFCSRKVNLLFSTYVVKEGIDVSRCSAAVSFDLPQTAQSHIQSRVQALQENSQYFVMLERGNTKQVDHMARITVSERLMIQTATNRVSKTVVKDHVTNKTHAYVVDSTGVSVTANSSISLIHRYCDKLPGDKNSRKPKFESVIDGNLIRCKLTLPPSAAFQTIIGSEAHNFHTSRQLVCLDACKELHIKGALDDHLIPVTLKSLQNNSSSNVAAVTSGAGSTKRKELHGSVSIRSKSGTWGDKHDGAAFYAYRMDFCCNLAWQRFSSFVLLLETKLDDDVGNIEVELFLLSKFVKASVSFHGQISLNADQVAGAKCFQQLIFNGIFGKMFIKLDGARKFLFQTELSLWDPSNMYLLLPVESMDEASDGNLKFKWIGIQSCVSAVEFLKKNAWLNNKQPESTDSNSSVHANDLGVAEFSSDAIHLADQSVSVDSLKEMVVIAIHTGRVYSILKTVANSSAQSPFDGDTARYSSFADYYHKRYGIILKHPEQPLLLLKQSHNSHNLLVDFRDEGLPKAEPEGGEKTSRKTHVVKPQQHAHMPPELLVGTDLQIDVFKSVYLLPSLIHRLESLMLASQLREEISQHIGNFNIASSMILEALTTLRCCENFSMERLELLGDSVLKYTVSCHLFLKNPKKHEGYLSACRSKIVSNASLHKLGTSRKLQEYIRDTPFEPRRWIAPGQRSMWPSPCSHGVNTTEVPLEDKYFSEDIKLMLGKTCDRGHRWMISKTISDCVEALIGAYFLGGGLAAALGFLKWLGIEARNECSLVDNIIQVTSLYSYAPKAEVIGNLESKLGYEFSVKGLLLEAITHESLAEQGARYSYGRLEFLGDAVLDILITRYLYDNHRNLDPGDLTDLRSASVNNDNFAIVAVRRNLHTHLQHCTSFLQDEISKFVEYVSSLTGTTLSPDMKAPKVLGDLVESIVGAVLVDSKLNLEEVWKVLEPILSPIVTPDKLELPPSRELIELCDARGYFVKQHFTANGGVINAELTLQLEDVLLDGQGSGPNRKAAKGMAALQILKKLELRGISRKNHDEDNVNGASRVDSQISSATTELGPALKRHKTLESQPEVSVDDQACDSGGTTVPVLPPIKMKKGGPRSSLYALCKEQQWPMPSFQTTEQKFRTLIQLGDASGFNSFESQITLVIPGSGKVEVTGEARADKKSSYDSAALTMLYELKRQGKIMIGG